MALHSLGNQLGSSPLRGWVTHADQQPVEERDNRSRRVQGALVRGLAPAGLCAQRIAASELARVTHSAQVVADRAGVSADARIVKLRRIGRKPTDEAKPVDWQHRWTVRMHKVRQWYPSEEVHRVIYRGPYVKGSEGKPFIGGETTWGVVRWATARAVRFRGRDGDGQPRQDAVSHGQMIRYH